MLSAGGAVSAADASDSRAGALKLHGSIANSVCDLFLAFRQKAEFAVKFHRERGGMNRHFACGAVLKGMHEKSAADSPAVMISVYKKQCDVRAAVSCSQYAEQLMFFISAV